MKSLRNFSLLPHLKCHKIEYNFFCAALLYLISHENAFITQFSLSLPSSKRFNSSLSNLLIDGIDKFRINYVKFSWRDKSMNFSLTFSDLRSNGSYAGVGNFINYVPIRGRGNYNFDAFSKSS